MQIQCTKYEYKNVRTQKIKNTIKDEKIEYIWGTISYDKVSSMSKINNQMDILLFILTYNSDFIIFKNNLGFSFPCFSINFSAKLRHGVFVNE